MFNRKERYETGDDSEPLDNLSRKLTVDLRKNVRKLNLHDPISRDWLENIEAITHVSNIAVMEHRLPLNEDGTLWEGDQLTVRFLLEEGKLNLCVRLIQAYKRFAHANPVTTRVWLTERASRLGTATVDGPEGLRAKLLSFEQSIGILLRWAFEHVEAVQTVDLHLLLEHSSQARQSPAAAPAVPRRPSHPPLMRRWSPTRPSATRRLRSRSTSIARRRPSSSRTSAA